MRNKTLLCFNVHYAPNSFGGATIVAEEVNRHLVQDFGWEVTVITTEQNKDLFPYQVRKYRAKEVDVFSINLPDRPSFEESYTSLKIQSIVDTILRGHHFDFAHLHAIQNIGKDILNILKEREIKTVITLHDCWWICQRQFMINNHGKYCFQEKIDDNVCLHCVSDPTAMILRKSALQRNLKLADLLLFPSLFHKKFHVQNGFDEKICRVSKNGILFPKPSFQKSRSKKVRFGYVGGPGFIKGAELVKEVFKDLNQSNWELVLVDAGKNVGKSWEKDFKSWELGRNAKVIPGYDQNSMDDFFGHIDVLLFPSQWKESFGLTVREALVRDIWVISTDGGGTVEDIVDGENGTIIPLTRDTKFLRAAIQMCLIKNWDSYNNEHKDKIRSYEQQANELCEMFIGLEKEVNE